jgi:hypothetical protein
MPQLDLLTEERNLKANEEERRRWLEKLRLRLQDPEFRKTSGFPKASDEAILALSDPPYYTTCPNPFLTEILDAWTKEQEGDQSSSENHEYHRDPFASDVSEGKNDPIYNAHSYHTKVPHKAIMRYILHYTNPGDIVLDGFCGTGMTGVAAQLCGDKKTVESLGCRVDDDKAILQLGARRAVLIDLSPAATFIAYNYNTPLDTQAFEREARRILAVVEKKCGWMYETIHTDGKTKGRINFTVWSDVFLCPSCGTEIVFWDVAVDHQKRIVHKDWNCPSCRSRLSKSRRKENRSQIVARAFETKYDRALGKPVRQAKQVPVLINYSVGKKRYEKGPDKHDLALIAEIENSDISCAFPTSPMMFKGGNWGDTWRAGIHAGLTHVHHFYTRRNLWALATIWQEISTITNGRLRAALMFLWQSLALGYTKLNRYGATHYSQVNRILSGTLYVSSMISEVSIQYAYLGKVKRLSRVFANGYSVNNSDTAISTNSSDTIRLSNASIDYVFVDPPFGENLMYSELNFLWEAWREVFTNIGPEAIINKTQRKVCPSIRH